MASCGFFSLNKNGVFSLIDFLGDRADGCQKLTSRSLADAPSRSWRAYRCWYQPKSVTAVQPSMVEGAVSLSPVYARSTS